MDKLKYKYILLFDNYVEHFIEKYNKINEEQIKVYKSVSICKKQSAYSVLKLQPSCDLLISEGNGIVFSSPKYSDRIHDFLNQSLKSEFDLVLSPEYSVPLFEIEQLLKDDEKISEGSLYCLGCQGVPKNDFRIFLDNMKKKYEVCEDCYDYVKVGSIVCAIIYIIKIRFICNHSSFQKIFIVPQIKTNPMKDPQMNFERSLLATGEKVIAFGSENDTRVLGIICSDIFNFELMNEIKNYVAHNRVLLLHPQLNPKPQNDYFRFMRTMLINYSNSNSIKIITANWSQDTTFSFEGNPIKTYPIKDSWSAVYEKYNSNEIKEYFDLFKANARKGVNFAHDHHIISIYFPSEEFIVDYQVRCLASSNNPDDIQKTIPLKVSQYYGWINNSLEANDYRCELMIDDFFINEDAFSLLNSCKICKGTNCSECKINDLNVFLASVLQREVENEFEIINDGKVSSVTAKHYRSEYSKEKLYMCKKILFQMKNHKVTNLFTNAKDFKFLTSSSNDLFFNVQYSIDGYPNRLARIVFLKNVQKSEAEKVYNYLAQKYGSESENVMVFYESEEGVFVYPESLVTSITGDTRKNNSLII